MTNFNFGVFDVDNQGSYAVALNLGGTMNIVNRGPVTVWINKAVRGNEYGTGFAGESGGSVRLLPGEWLYDVPDPSGTGVSIPIAATESGSARIECFAGGGE